MKHVLILRGLGFVLVIALAVNITAVLAAPFYLDSGDQLAQASPDNQKPKKPKPKQPTDSPAEDAVADTAPIVIDGDVVQSDSTAESDLSDRPQRAVDSDPTLGVVDDQQSPLAATLQSESERILFGLGVQIGSKSHQEPVAGAVRRFLRRRPLPNTEDGENDLLPTVEITSPDVQQEANDPAAVDVDEPTSPSAERIVVENPVENGYTVRFQLDGTLQTLKPGAVLIETSNQSVVRFDRGGSFGETRQEIATGRYRFRVTQEGWKLEKAEKGPAS